MADFLLQLSQNRRFRSTLRTFGLSLPLPEPLRRDRGPLDLEFLRDRRVLVVAARHGELTSWVFDALAGQGGALYAGDGVDGPAASTVPASELEDAVRLDAIVVDATGLDTQNDVRGLYEALQPWAGRVQRSGRVVVLTRPLAEATTSAQAAAIGAADGFVRSVAKEVGRQGATANLLRVASGAEGRLAPVLRFVLSPRAAFVSAQPIDIDTVARAATTVARPDRPLLGKRALVTGAARGIGAATAQALAALGATVIVHDRPQDEDAVRSLARDLRGEAVLADLLEPEAAGIIADALRASGGVDIVVHNAGITRDRTLARMKPENWDLVLEVNLNAILRLHAALLDGVLNEGGRVICLSSIAGIAGNMGQTAYAASKAAVAAFVKAEAPRLAGQGITVNAIAPGFIETRMTAAVPVAIREFGRRLSALSQGGLPDDVANAIAFLATPGAHGVTGRVVRVCGGAFLGA
jgi:3-oxoacyl-[acyl-carrier protein] reductase